MSGISFEVRDLQYKALKTENNIEYFSPFRAIEVFEIL